jgi:hypothetical protein
VTIGVYTESPVFGIGLSRETIFASEHGETVGWEAEGGIGFIARHIFPCVTTQNAVAIGLQNTRHFAIIEEHELLDPFVGICEISACEGRSNVAQKSGVRRCIGRDIGIGLADDNAL